MSNPNTEQSTEYGRDAMLFRRDGSHLSDHAFTDPPLRQWSLTVLKRLRYFRECDAGLRASSPGASGCVNGRLRKIPP